MSYRENVHRWTLPTNDPTMAQQVALALRLEYANTDAVVKRIARTTGVSCASVRKWYEARNTPKVKHLMLLARTYPKVQTLVSLWITCEPYESGSVSLLNQVKTAPIYPPDHVGINVRLPNKVAGILNHRQLWFIAQLQLGISVRGRDLRKVWRLTTRTAERDLARLVAINAIVFQGARKNGCYLLTADYMLKA
jgi:hypothetical protein